MLITADRLTAQLLTSSPADFEGVSQFGHTIPAYKLRWPGIAGQSVKVEDGRQGSREEETHIRDIIRMIPLAMQGRPELDFHQTRELQTALANLLQKRPALAKALKAKIKCSTIFQNY
ncbi:antigen variant [Penicillium chermesinum]|uniref:Antigen variant n=1 Tax=Penicillium chermesinum TaxID=63820 RepID=A0A9W9PJL5_9EURO|nr:antigen variant [Penicillium chermesinum]KAJ5248655.1 antigen variant [Penicillium chermesinum]